MSTFLVPLQNVPQSFDISLGGKDYVMTCRWCDAPESGWMFDLSDADSGDPLVAGVPLTTGANLLEGLEYLGIGGSFVIFTDGDDFAVPTLTNLGVESNLYYVTSDAA